MNSKIFRVFSYLVLVILVSGCVEGPAKNQSPVQQTGASDIRQFNESQALQQADKDAQRAEDHFKTVLDAEGRAGEQANNLAIAKLQADSQAKSLLQSEADKVAAVKAQQDGETMREWIKGGIGLVGTYFTSSAQDKREDRRNESQKDIERMRLQATREERGAMNDERRADKADEKAERAENKNLMKEQRLMVEDIQAAKRSLEPAKTELAMQQAAFKDAAKAGSLTQSQMDRKMDRYGEGYFDAYHAAKGLKEADEDEFRRKSKEVSETLAEVNSESSDLDSAMSGARYAGDISEIKAINDSTYKSVRQRMAKTNERIQGIDLDSPVVFEEPPPVRDIQIPTPRPVAQQSPNALSGDEVDNLLLGANSKEGDFTNFKPQDASLNKVQEFYTKVNNETDPEKLIQISKELESLSIPTSTDDGKRAKNSITLLKFYAREKSKQINDAITSNKGNVNDMEAAINQVNKGRDYKSMLEMVNGGMTGGKTVQGQFLKVEKAETPVTLNPDDLFRDLDSANSSSVQPARYANAYGQPGGGSLYATRGSGSSVGSDSSDVDRFIEGQSGCRMVGDERICI